MSFPKKSDTVDLWSAKIEKEQLFISTACIQRCIISLKLTEILSCFKGLPWLQYSNTELGQNQYGCSLKASEFNSKISFQVLKLS